MQTINNSDSKDVSINLAILAQIPDKSECNIIMAIWDISKTVSQIC